MKAIIKTIITAATLLFMQSCNMSKHYANMRIGQGDAQTIAIAEKKPETAAYNNIIPQELLEKPVVADSGITKQILYTDTICKNNIASVAQQCTLSKRTSLKIYNSHSPVIKKKKTYTKNTRKRRLNLSAAKWIDVDEELTYVYIGVGIIAICIILILCGIFNGLGAIILAILGGIALIFVGAILFGLLIMGFLRMCGLNW